MKVLHVIPRWIGGGPERHLVELARQDALNHHHVDRRVLVLDRPLSAPLWVAARRFGMTLVNEPWVDVIDREIERADLVEITYWNHPLMSQLLRRSLPECRVVYRVAIAGHSMPQMLSPELTAHSDAWVLSAPYGFGATHLKDQHPLVAHIPALADMSRLHNYQPREHDGVRVSYLGSLTQAKLHTGLPNIVAHVDSTIRFDLFGDADNQTLSHLSEQLQIRGVANRVNVRGHVEDIAEALSETDIFVLPLNPYSYATSEKSLQEAMWIGLPPVILTGTAAEGWIEHGTSGYIASDEVSFAEFVNLLALNSQLRQKIGLAAQTYARKHFDPRQNASRIHDIYRRVMGVQKRIRQPMFVEATTGSQIFLRVLGLTRNGLQQHIELAAETADTLRSQLLRSEGGVLHYLKHYQEDLELRELAATLS